MTVPGIEYPYDTRLNLSQRLREARIRCAYVQKQDTGKGFTATRHVDVISKARQAFIDLGIDWWLASTDRIDSGCSTWHEGTETGGTRSIRLVPYKLTFGCCTCEDPSSVRWVIVVSEGLDDEDKGPGKASTYAEKIALTRLLHLEAGEDPDFTVEPSAERQELLDQIAQLAEQRAPGEASREIDGVLVKLRRKFPKQKLNQLGHVPDDLLVQWRDHWRAEVGIVGGGGGGSTHDRIARNQQVIAGTQDYTLAAQDQREEQVAQESGPAVPERVAAPEARAQQQVLIPNTDAGKPRKPRQPRVKVEQDPTPDSPLNTLTVECMKQFQAAGAMVKPDRAKAAVTTWLQNFNVIPENLDDEEVMALAMERIGQMTHARWKPWLLASQPA